MTPTPAQIAYAAYARALNLKPSLTWRIMPPRHQHAWEAAAQAVRADALCQGETSTGTMTPTQCLEELRRLVGQYWIDVEDARDILPAVNGEDSG